MIRFELIEDLDVAKEVWNRFSPSLSLYDLWDFRYIFYKYKPAKIQFYVLYENDSPVGLFPLQKNLEDGYLEFFGGSYMENNQVFTRPGDESYRETLYNQITELTHLEYIIGDDKATQALPIMDDKYFLTCSKVNTLEDYFQNYLEKVERFIYPKL